MLLIAFIPFVLNPRYATESTYDLYYIALILNAGILHICIFFI
jgi:hypothetical protein